MQVIFKPFLFMRPSLNNADITRIVESLSAERVHLIEQIRQTKKQLGQINNSINPARHYQTDTPLQEIVEKIEKAYVYLEHIAMTEAKSFSDSGRANLRRAQSELQRARLKLDDLVGRRPLKSTG